MSNLHGTLKINTTYVDPEAATARTPEYSLTFAYQSQSHGTIDIPDQEGGGTPHRIPFGSIDAATAIMIVNRTANGENPGQDLLVQFNQDGQNPFSIPAGGTLVVGGAWTCGTPLSTVCLLTCGTQTGPGLVSYHVFGDPVGG